MRFWLRALFWLVGLCCMLGRRCLCLFGWRLVSFDLLHACFLGMHTFSLLYFVSFLSVRLLGFGVNALLIQSMMLNLHVFSL